MQKIKSVHDGKMYPPTLKEYNEINEVQKAIIQCSDPSDFKTYKDHDKDTRFSGHPLLKSNYFSAYAPEGSKPDWLTPEVELEWKRCHGDIEYFAKNYCLEYDCYGGFRHIRIRDYHLDMIEVMANNRTSIHNLARQLGKMTAVSVFLSHYVCLNDSKHVVILAHKNSMAMAILERIKTVISLLPDFLQPGIVSWNDKSIELENGCLIEVGETSTLRRPIPCGLLYIDESAWIDDFPDTFGAILPVISSGRKSKIILTSTPNGLNHWYQLWENALKTEDGLKPYTANWTSIKERLYNEDGEFDDGKQWSANQINASSNEAFLQEHCAEFQNNVPQRKSFEELLQEHCAEFYYKSK